MMFRALETTTDNCSQVFLAVHMVEIVGVLLEEIGGDSFDNMNLYLVFGM
jgi:hypothetical protein